MATLKTELINEYITKKHGIESAYCYEQVPVRTSVIVDLPTSVAANDVVRLVPTITDNMLVSEIIAMNRTAVSTGTLNLHLRNTSTDDSLGELVKYPDGTASSTDLLGTITLTAGAVTTILSKDGFSFTTLHLPARIGDLLKVEKENWGKRSYELCGLFTAAITTAGVLTIAIDV